MTFFQFRSKVDPTKWPIIADAGVASPGGGSGGAPEKNNLNPNVPEFVPTFGGGGGSGKYTPVTAAPATVATAMTTTKANRNDDDEDTDGTDGDDEADEEEESAAAGGATRKQPTKSSKAVDSEALRRSLTDLIASTNASAPTDEWVEVNSDFSSWI